MYAPCIKGVSSQLLAVTCGYSCSKCRLIAKSKMAKWRAAVGLEVHAESATVSKLFSREANLRAREFSSLTLLFPEHYLLAVKS